MYWIEEANIRVLHAKEEEEVLRDILQAGYATTTDSLKNAFFRCVESVITDMVQEGALNDLFS